MGRTAFLIVGAAALGVLAGTITGYAIQYDREPTPLPPLAQQTMAGPKPQAMNDQSTRHSINANRWHKADEELAKKLLDVPSGAKSEFSGVTSLDIFAAGYYEEVSEGLGGLITDRTRSIASVAWAESDRNFIEIDLLQFHDRNEAEDFQLGIEHYMPTKEYAGNAGREVPGVPDEYGHMWVDSKAQQKAGYEPLRGGRAVVRRGDVVAVVQYVNNRGDVDENVVADLAKRQMERL
ncbi:hypothetical protein ACGFYY_33185 [Streptomyces sp. NPDC048331]|uniref:hypothetical protein n=1 Tax=Streptomyces sp. NPDC048331 TaxID=3365534 RepID=UPI00371DAA35